MKHLRSIFLLLCSLLAFPASAANMPKVGDTAPDFSLPGQDGENVSLSDYKGSWVVLYFYPKDFTSGCSLEAHNFEADSALYKARHAVILGVSVDSVESHKNFCTKQGLNFKLLADEKHEVSSLYDTYTSLVGIARRNTFLIDPKGVVSKVYTGVKPATHSKEVLADIASLQPKESK